MKPMTPEPWPPDEYGPIPIRPLDSTDGASDDEETAETYRYHCENIAQIISNMPKRDLFMRTPLAVARAQVALYLESVGLGPC